MTSIKILGALLLLAGCAGTGVGLDSNGLPCVCSVPSAGSPDGLPTPTPIPGATHSYQVIQTTIFTARCIKCHSGASAPQGLQLSAANSYASLVGVSSSEVPSLKRIVAKNPTDSYLYIKIVGTDSRMSGERMPRDGPPYLTQEQIDYVKEWILEGAPNN